eukprot:1205840-Pleurochrysis_carterae.AAC.1
MSCLHCDAEDPGKEAQRGDQAVPQGVERDMSGGHHKGKDGGGNGDGGVVSADGCNASAGDNSVLCIQGAGDGGSGGDGDGGGDDDGDAAAGGVDGTGTDSGDGYDGVSGNRS